MPASSQHPAYSASLLNWELVRDCVEGESAVKCRGGSSDDQRTLSGSGTRYLPAPNPEDVSQDNVFRYQAYLKRASYVNFTGFTKESLVGMVYRKDSTIDLPSGIDYLNDNADGGGTGLDQIIRDGLADSMETGRYGLLADYPKAEEGLTQAEVQSLGLQATICTYPAESIVNWRWESIGSKMMLTMVSLKEMRKRYTDDFEYDEVCYHRVLWLQDGVYVQVLFDNEDKPVAQDEEGNAVITPRKADGSTWDIIPFQFVGSQNNDPTPDKSILLDMANVNISHYRNSADYEESSFMVGQPTAAIAGLSQSWVTEVLKDGVILGSRRALLLPEGGSASLMQADPNQMPEKGMERKEQQMVMIGARIIQDAGGVETAEAAKIKFAGQNSKLAVLASNWVSAMTNVVGWVGEFMGVTGDVTVELNKNYYDKTADPQKIMAAIQLVDRGVIARSDLRSDLRRSGIIDHDRTDEDIDAEASVDSPL